MTASELWADGQRLLGEGRPGAALEAFVRSLQADDSEPAPFVVSAQDWHYRGAAWACLGGFEKALDGLGRALEMDPRNSNARLDRVMVLTASGRLDEAVAAAREATRLEPERAAGWNALGQIHNVLEQPLPSLHAFAQSRRLDLSAENQQRYLQALRSQLFRLDQQNVPWPDLEPFIDYLQEAQLHLDNFPTGYELVERYLVGKTQELLADQCFDEADALFQRLGRPARELPILRTLGHLKALVQCGRFSLARSVKLSELELRDLVDRTQKAFWDGKEGRFRASGLEVRVKMQPTHANVVGCAPVVTERIPDELERRARAFWKEYARWLGREPDWAAGASAEMLLEAACQLGHELPVHLRALLSIHDGCADLFPNYGDLLSVRVVLDNCQLMTDLERQEGAELNRDARPQGPVKRRWYHRSWIPFALAPNGDHLCVDLDPAKGGRVGQVISWQHDDGKRAVLAPSLLFWCEGLLAQPRNPADPPDS